MQQKHLRALLSMPTTKVGAPQQKEFYFVFKLKPEVKERGRAMKKNDGTLFIRTPDKTRRYEERIGQLTRLQYPLSKPLTGPLIASLMFTFKSDPDGDLDNYVKAILDGMQQGKAFGNDKQIRGINAHVIYFNELEEDTTVEERTEVILSPRANLTMDYNEYLKGEV